MEFSDKDLKVKGIISQFETTKVLDPSLALSPSSISPSRIRKFKGKETDAQPSVKAETLPCSISINICVLDNNNDKQENISKGKTLPIYESRIGNYNEGDFQSERKDSKGSNSLSPNMNVVYDFPSSPRNTPSPNEEVIYDIPSSPLSNKPYIPNKRSRKTNDPMQFSDNRNDDRKLLDELRSKQSRRNDKQLKESENQREGSDNQWIEYNNQQKGNDNEQKENDNKYHENDNKYNENDNKYNENDNKYNENDNQPQENYEQYIGNNNQSKRNYIQYKEYDNPYKKSYKEWNENNNRLKGDFFHVEISDGCSDTNEKNSKKSCENNINEKANESPSLSKDTGSDNSYVNIDTSSIISEASYISLDSLNLSEFLNQKPIFPNQRAEYVNQSQELLNKSPDVSKNCSTILDKFPELSNQLGNQIREHQNKIPSFLNGSASYVSAFESAQQINDTKNREEIDNKEEKLDKGMASEQKKSERQPTYVEVWGQNYIEPNQNKWGYGDMIVKEKPCVNDGFLQNTSSQQNNPTEFDLNKNNSAQNNLTQNYAILAEPKQTKLEKKYSKPNDPEQYSETYPESLNTKPLCSKQINPDRHLIKDIVSARPHGIDNLIHMQQSRCLAKEINQTLLNKLHQQNPQKLHNFSKIHRSNSEQNICKKINDEGGERDVTGENSNNRNIKSIIKQKSEISLCDRDSNDYVIMKGFVCAQSAEKEIRLRDFSYKKKNLNLLMTKTCAFKTELSSQTSVDVEGKENKKVDEDSDVHIYHGIDVRKMREGIRDENSYLSTISAYIKSRKLIKLLEELLETEKIYVANLHKVVYKYDKHIRAIDAPIIGKEEIFGNIEKIYEESQSFYDCLVRCNFNVDQIAKVFIFYEEILFALYPIYCKNKPLADKAISLDDQGILKRRQKELGDPLNLASYLLLPIQRMGKYVLLLEGMENEIKAQDGNYKVVKMAKEMVQSHMSQANTFLTLDNVNNFPYKLYETGLFQLKDVFQIGKSKGVTSDVLLFENFIILAKYQPDCKKYHCNEIIKTCEIGIAPADEKSLVIKLKIFNSGKCVRYIDMIAPSKKVKKVWLGELQKILWRQLYQKKEVQKTLRLCTTDIITTEQLQQVCILKSAGK